MCNFAYVNSAATNTCGLVALSPAALETLLARRSVEGQRGEGQAVEDQAQNKWIRGYIGIELIRLYEAEPTRHLIVEVSKAFMSKLRTVHELMESSAGDRAALAQDPDTLIGEELAALRDHVGPETASAAEWVWHGALRPWQAWARAAVTGRESPAVELRATSQAAEDAELAVFLDTPEGGVLRSQCLLLAAFEGARRSLDVARVAELAYLAFEHACEGVDALAAHGLRLADYAVQSDEERVRRTVRSAQALRATLAERDFEAVRAARLVNLR